MNKKKFPADKHSSTYFNSISTMDDLRNKAIRGVGATVFSNAAVFVVQLIGTITLARLLTPSDFGLIGMVSAFSFLFMNVGNRGFTEATIQFDSIDHHKISTLFWIHIGISIVLMLSFIILSPTLAWFFKEPKLTFIAIAMSSTFLFTALSTQHLAEWIKL